MADNKDKKVLKVPDLRFPEFTDEWERKKFRDVCNITTGNKNTQDKSNDGIYPFYVRSQIVERINSWTFDGEAILTAGDGRCWQGFPLFHRENRCASARLYSERFQMRW